MQVGEARARAGSIATQETGQLARIGRWSGRTADVGLADLDFRPAEPVWELVRSDAGNCLKQSCPRHRECFVYRAARRTRSAGVLVVDHALYLSDLALRARGAALLPEPDVAIFDEAHAPADVAAAHLGPRVASGAVANLIHALAGPVTRPPRAAYQKLEAMNPSE